MVPSHDGVEVPMNIYYKKGMKFDLDRKNRVLLEGYGAYGLNLSQGFNIVKTSAMEKGWNRLHAHGSHIQMVAAHAASSRK